MTANVLYEAGEVVNAVQECLRDGTHSLSTLPGLVKRMISLDLWQERLVIQTRETVRFERFEDFVAAHLPEGLHTDIQTLKNICRDDREARAAIDEATKREPHRPKSVNNVNSSRPVGNSSDAAVRRLRKDREDLFRQVLDGDLTPHAAAVKAGFRQKTITVPIDAQKAAVTITKHFPREARLELVRLLSEVD